MSDIGYLQTKIRELTEKVDSLSNDLTSLKDKDLSKDLDILFKKIREQNKEMVNFFIEDQIEKIYKENFKENYQKGYDDLHSRIGKELELLKKSNRDVILRFIKEVTLQRKDLGVILSILLSKNIIDKDDMNIIDEKIRKEMINEKVDEKILEMFYPILEKILKI